MCFQNCRPSIRRSSRLPEALLDRPRFYRWVQNLLGARRLQRTFLRRYVQPGGGDRILDLGCGPGYLLEELHEVQYVGIDLNPAHIVEALRRYPGRARFFCQRLGTDEPLPKGPFDRVLAVGLLHHLDDESVRRLMGQAAAELAPGGRLVTIDCCFAPQQSFWSRWLVSRDRGQFVRQPHQYEALARAAFPSVESAVHHNLLRIPYSHTVLCCQRGDA